MTLESNRFHQRQHKYTRKKKFDPLSRFKQEDNSFRSTGAESNVKNTRNEKKTVIITKQKLRKGISQPPKNFDFISSTMIKCRRIQLQQETENYTNTNKKATERTNSLPAPVEDTLKLNIEKRLLSVPRARRRDSLLNRNPRIEVVDRGDSSSIQGGPAEDSTTWRMNDLAVVNEAAHLR